MKVPLTSNENMYVVSTGHQLYLGSSQRKFSASMTDACKDLFNPYDIYYKFFKNKKRCPWSAGVSERFE